VTARFAFAADPRALADLLQAPSDIRDLALLQLDELVTGTLQGSKLTGDLAGYRKVRVDHRAEWRIVYQLRPAPAACGHTTEIYLLAVRRRADNDVYDTVAARLGIDHRPVSALAHAARARSPQRTVAHLTPVDVPSAPQLVHGHLR
jgi:mRNA interferase RelE/StbE